MISQVSAFSNIHWQGLLGALMENDVQKLNKKIGPISNARWMAKAIAAQKASLFKGQFPESVISKEEMTGYR